MPSRGDHGWRFAARMQVRPNGRAGNLCATRSSFAIVSESQARILMSVRQLIRTSICIRVCLVHAHARLPRRRLERARATPRSTTMARIVGRIFGFSEFSSLGSDFALSIGGDHSQQASDDCERVGCSYGAYPWPDFSTFMVHMVVGLLVGFLDFSDFTGLGRNVDL